jgi:peptidoglycan/LPS O-acetylase OafA/YrhL
MIFTLLIFGCFYLSIVDYSTLSKHSISSLGFFSNLFYLSEAGYFDDSSHKKWLLHTWSLSVEWQFYMFYPVVLFAAFKFGSKVIAEHIVKILCLFSFVYCVYLSYVAPNSAFYILPT